MRIAVWHNLRVAEEATLLSCGGSSSADTRWRSGAAHRGSGTCPTRAWRACRALRWSLPGSRPAGALFFEYRNTIGKLAGMDRPAGTVPTRSIRVATTCFINACTFFRLTSIGRHVRIPSHLPAGAISWLTRRFPSSVDRPARAREQRLVAALPPPEALYRNRGRQALRVQARELLSARRSQHLVNSHFSREVSCARTDDAKVLPGSGQWPVRGSAAAGRFLVGLGAGAGEAAGVAVERYPARASPRPGVDRRRVAIEAYANQLRALARTKVSTCGWRASPTRTSSGC
jgi:hypothetical protein